MQAANEGKEELVKLFLACPRVDVHFRNRVFFLKNDIMHSVLRDVMISFSFHPYLHCRMATPRTLGQVTKT